VKVLIIILLATTFASSQMRFSECGKAFTKSYEGLHRVRKDGLIEAYRDPIGIPTIGFGTTKNINMGYVIDRARADFYFDYLP